MAKVQLDVLSKYLGNANETIEVPVGHLGISKVRYWGN